MPTSFEFSLVSDIPTNLVPDQVDGLAVEVSSQMEVAVDPHCSFLRKLSLTVFNF